VNVLSYAFLASDTQSSQTNPYFCERQESDIIMKILKVLAALLLVLTAIPVFAQEEPLNTVSYNGFTFSFDSSLGNNVSIIQYLTDLTDVMPSDAKQTHFVLSNDQWVMDSIVGIRVYKMADLTSFNHTQQQVTKLQQLLAERHDLGQFETTSENTNAQDNTLPFLPVIAAGQTLRARVHYVGTPELSGISYITAYQQAAQPLVQADALYTFQGMTADGAYYVSVVFRVQPEAFPGEIAADFNYEAFLADIAPYFDETTTQLNAATPASFAPSLQALDDLTQSITWQ
jgi:hypothetical protein